MQTELHRHLDVSIRLPTLLRLAQERGLEAQSTSLESFRKKIILDRPLADLGAVIETFTLFQKVLDRPAVLEQVAFEVVEDCWNEGTRAVELRFSPSFVGEYSGISWEEILSCFERGRDRALKKHPGMRAGFLCIATREFGVDSVDRTVEFFLKCRDRFLGMDLAGEEEKFPCRLFEKSFKKIAAVGGKVTIHAGEACGPENVWEAIELLGARRIGHGISSIQDPKLIDHLISRKICLEMCPTSNWITRAVPSLEKHPLPLALRKGVQVSVNTDDPGVFGTTIPQELAICRDKMGMSEAEIAKCLENATASTFL